MFPSVATNPFNYLILGAGCGCHNQFDRTWQDAAEMQIWKTAVERLVLIIPAVAKNELRLIPEIITEAIKNQ